MKTVFTILLFLLTNFTFSQDYVLKIYNSKTNRKTYFREKGDKVKIWTINSRNAECFVKARINYINKDSISFAPRNKKFKTVITSTKDLYFIGIRTPGMIITSYLTSITSILISGITRTPPPRFLTAYRTINFEKEKWSKEIILKIPD